MHFGAFLPAVLQGLFLFDQESNIYTFNARFFEKIRLNLLKIRQLYVLYNLNSNVTFAARSCVLKKLPKLFICAAARDAGKCRFCLK